YYVTNSRTFKQSLEITMKIEDQPFFLLPVDNYRADLNIVDSEGKELIILSDREFEKYTGISMKDIINMYLGKLRIELPEEHFRLIKDYRVIAVLFNRDDKSYYEKIKVTWVQRFVNRKRSKISISEYVEIPIYLPRYGFEHGATSAIYLSVKTSSKYRITETPTIRDLRLRRRPTYRTIIEDDRHRIYRFAETENPQFLEVIIKIGLPQTIQKWAQLGLIAILIIPTTVFTLTIYFQSIPRFGFETLVGVIGFVIGLRVLIFHDLDLMVSWNRILFWGVVGCSILLLLLMVLSNDNQLMKISATIEGTLKIQ
ncbi:MAG: hypothetical protein WAM14_08030, partial [Candidatus Nitrosopolaris sp.]